MRPRFIQTGSAKGTARVSIDLPVGRYSALYLNLVGTTDTAQTLAAADVGRIRIQRGGREIQNEDWEFYYEYSDLKTGWPHSTLPAAGASRLAILVPFQASGLPNSLDVLSKEEVDVFLDFDVVLDTRFGSNAATYEVYGLLAPTQPEVYELHVEQQDIVASAASRLTDKLSGRNVAAIYLKDAAPAVSSVTITVDGQVIVNEINDLALLDLTNMLNRKEATGNALIEVQNVVTGNLAEVTNANVEIDATFSGAGTLEVTKFRAEPSGRAAQSRQSVNALLGSTVTGVARGVPSRPAGAVS